MRLSEAPLKTPTTSPMAPRMRAFLGRLGAAACSAKIVLLVLVVTAASLVATASAVHAASARPFNPDVGMYGDPLAAAPYWRLQHPFDSREGAVADAGCK